MTIVKLYVAANQISPSGWGHLQIVGEDENGELFELEVQAGANWIVYGDGSQLHIENTPGYGEPENYKIAELDLSGRNANDVWELLKQISASIDDYIIDYTADNNSNTYVNTMLNAVGINVSSYIDSITPSNVTNGFPGLNANDGAHVAYQEIAFQVSGTDAADIIRGGIWDDVLAGGQGRDDIAGDVGADILVGGAVEEGFKADDLQDGNYVKIYHPEWDDGARDILNGGEGDDVFLVSGSIAVYPTWFADELNRNWVSRESAEAIKTLDLIDGSDKNFTVYAQSSTEDGSETYVTNITATELEQATNDIDDDLVDREFSSLYTDGDLINTLISHIGFHNFVFNDIGAVLVVTVEDDYKTSFAQYGVTNFITYDPSSTEDWVFVASDSPSSGDNDSGIAGGSATESRSAESFAGADFTLSNGWDLAYGGTLNDMFRLGLYSVGDDVVYGGGGQDTVDYSGETQDLTITFTGVVSSSGEKFWKVSGDGEFSQSGGNQSYYTYDDKLFSIENITGGSGNDTITAGEDANTLNGSEGGDILAGGAGDDYLIGGAGADIFVFSSSAQGADWIEDFTVNEDRIDISDITSFDDFSDVIAIAEELDGTTWLKFDETNSIRLQNVALHSLSANDFMLA
ncbi:hypothetical protein FS763_06315 [Agrobacterium vitis]|uniref:M10 family metallopeptidase C-terminal domain-containing protein n=1 Tax=Allorhizobium ampelinum TaxID=3025782 RepID=UPI001F3D4CB9|nr:M10 family metallopeptidase C-terminal domain-containing protein [Allorhizobium ampelinum]MCF1471535.1 hypothetical protein [Allorhizobium ampelinum]